MDDHIVSLVISGIILWSTSFILFRKTLSNFSFDFCSRLVSTIHASLAVCLASLSVQDWSCPVSPQASLSSPSQKRTLAVTLSYLIYDIGCCFLNKQLHMDNLVHHLVSITGIVACLLYGMRVLVKELGFRDTDLNLVVDILFATLFSFGRMVGGPYVTYSTWAVDNPLLIKVMSMGLQLVSIYWFFKILRLVKYKFLQRKNKTSKQ